MRFASFWFKSPYDRQAAPDLLQAYAGLKLERKKLRAVIVIGFSLLASLAKKQSPRLPSGQPRAFLQSALRVDLRIGSGYVHAAGRATFRSMPACQYKLLAGYPSTVSPETLSGMGLKDGFTVARSRTTRKPY
jgi:hypothetical protein